MTTVARSTDGIIDPPLELRRELGSLLVDEVEDELMVSLRSGQPRVYDPGDPRLPAEGGLGQLAQDAPPDGGVADDPLRRLGPPGLELGLDEDERPPAGHGQAKRRRQRGPAAR